MLHGIGCGGVGEGGVRSRDGGVAWREEVRQRRSFFTILTAAAAIDAPSEQLMVIPRGADPFLFATRHPQPGRR